MLPALCVWDWGWLEGCFRGGTPVVGWEGMSSLAELHAQEFTHMHTLTPANRGRK